MRREKISNDLRLRIGNYLEYKHKHENLQQRL